MKLLIFIVNATFSFVLFGCGGEGIPADPEVRDYSSQFTALPTAPIYPDDNPFNSDKEELGELLFWDPILSGEQNVSCASCHHPNFGWADGRRFSVGSDGSGLGPNRLGNEITDLHSPSIINVAFTGLNVNTETEQFVSGGYFWDLRADTLEEQSVEPIKSKVEMRGSGFDEQEIMSEVVLRLQLIPEYVERFEAAFGERDTINPENIAKAIATFERKITSSNSRFDQFLHGEQSVFSQQEIIGLNKFIDGGCARCHSGPMLSDNILHSGDIIVGDEAVRTPGLRNLAFTAPFMHDGSIQDVRGSVAIYEDRGDLLVTLDDDDFQDLEVFLNTLNDGNFYKDIPSSVPSGLKVGGDIQ